MVLAPGRRKCPLGLGRPISSTGVTKSRKWRCGVLLMLLRLAPNRLLPGKDGMVWLVPIEETPLAAPVRGVCGRLGVVPGVTMLLGTSIGMSRIACSSVRRRAGQR